MASFLQIELEKKAGALLRPRKPLSPMVSLQRAHGTGASEIWLLDWMYSISRCRRKEIGTMCMGWSEGWAASCSQRRPDDFRSKHSLTLDADGYIVLQSSASDGAIWGPFEPVSSYFCQMCKPGLRSFCKHSNMEGTQPSRAGVA